MGANCDNLSHEEHTVFWTATSQRTKSGRFSKYTKRQLAEELGLRFRTLQGILESLEELGLAKDDGEGHIEILTEACQCSTARYVVQTASQYRYGSSSKRPDASPQRGRALGVGWASEVEGGVAAAAPRAPVQRVSFADTDNQKPRDLGFDSSRPDLGSDLVVRITEGDPLYRRARGEAPLGAAPGENSSPGEDSRPEEISLRDMFPGMDLPRRKKPPPGQVDPRRRKAPERWTGLDLAWYFDALVRDSLIDKGYAIGPATDIRLLSRRFNSWREEGIEAQTLKLMVEAYARSTAARQTKIPPWRHFVWRREQFFRLAEKERRADDSNLYGRKHWGK